MTNFDTNFFCRLVFFKLKSSLYNKVVVDLKEVIILIFEFNSAFLR